MVTIRLSISARADSLIASEAVVRLITDVFVSGEGTYGDSNTC